MWKEIFSGLSSWGKEFGAYLAGTHPAAKTLTPFDDPALTPVRLVLDPLHVAKPFLGLMAKSGYLDRPLDPVSMALSGIVGKEGIEEAKKAPNFTEAGEKLVGSNPFSQIVFLGVDFLLPGPGELGKVARLAARMGDTTFSQSDQLAKAQDRFRELGILAGKGGQVSTPETVATLLDSQVWGELEDLDLASTLAKTYQDLEEEAFRLPGDPLSNLRSLAEEKARELYQAYERALFRSPDSFVPATVEAKVLGLLAGLEWMARGPRPWRWLEAFENVEPSFLHATPADTLLEAFRPRFLRGTRTLPETPLVYGPDQVENLLQISDYPALASIDLPLQLASWAQKLSPEEVVERIKRSGSLFGTMEKEIWADLAHDMTVQEVQAGIDSLGEMVARIAELDPLAGVTAAESLGRLEKALNEVLESGSLEDSIRAIRGLRTNLSRLAMWIEDSLPPWVLESDDRWLRIADWAKDLAEQYVLLETAVRNVREAIQVADHIDSLARFVGSRPGGWDMVRRIIEEEIIASHRGAKDRFLEDL